MRRRRRPNGELTEQLTSSPRQRAGTLRKVGLLLVPDVAHRSVAVAEMVGIGACDGPFGDTMAGADDQIVGVQVEGFDGAWKERQVAAVLLPGRGGVLEEARQHRMGFDFRTDTALEVEKGENWRLGSHVEQLLEYPLTATHAGQPVVDEGDS